MRIEHKRVGDYEGFQTLRVFADNGEMLFGVGVVLPGEYSLGVHKTGEKLEVLFGSMIVNGRIFDQGQTCTINPDVDVKIATVRVVVYKRT